MATADSDKPFFLTIDVEDWFQVENFRPWITVDSWSQRRLRVEKNVHCILDILDSVSVSSSQHNSKQLYEPSYFSSTMQLRPKATFFILGWIAERLPGLVVEIAQRGHEVASHGQMHFLNTGLSKEKLKNDLTRSKSLLEDITGHEVYGYRAPSFAINDSILDIICSCGFKYDSSYNSFALNPRYGHISLTNNIGNSVRKEIFPGFYEFPLSNLEVLKMIFPWSGGGYFRFIPLCIFIQGINLIYKKKNGYVFYLHPWEFDPDQPYFAQASKFYRFRHYVNIQKTAKKFTKLIQYFSSASFTTFGNSILNNHKKSR